MRFVAAAVKAGAYKQAVELLRQYRAGKLTHEQALVIRLGTGWDWAKPESENISVKRYDLQEMLMDAIEHAGFEVGGPTDSRAAENGEPVWVCNARLLISECNQFR